MPTRVEKWTQKGSHDNATRGELGSQPSRALRDLGICRTPFRKPDTNDPKHRLKLSWVLFCVQVESSSTENGHRRPADPARCHPRGERKRVCRIPCDANRKRACWHPAGHGTLRLRSRWQPERRHRSVAVQERGLRPPPPPVGASSPSRHRNVSRETFVLAPRPPRSVSVQYSPTCCGICGTEGGTRQRGGGRPGETLPIGDARGMP